MPAAYDLNHSKYTVQKITSEWKRKIRITTLVRNNENKKEKKSKQKPSATNTYRNSRIHQ